jgi:hypothetical protein
MIEQTRVPTAQPVELGRDERSMRVMEYVIALVALGAALLLSLR